jgi:Integrase zinc binding domain
VKGQDNIVADALSCLPCRETAVATEQASSPAEHLLRRKLHSDLVQDVEPLAPSSADPSFFNASESPFAFSVATNDKQLLECFVDYPAVVGTPLPLSYHAIATAQAQDAELQQRLTSEPNLYAHTWKICIPTQHLNDTILHWYHMSLGHPGMIRTHDTIALHFWHSHLRSQCKALIGACDSCQRS